MIRLSVSYISAVALLAVAGCGGNPASQSVDEPGKHDLVVGEVVPEKSLFITDLSVIEAQPYTTWSSSYPVYDVRGAWTFGRLIDNMLPYGQRNAIGRSRFVMRWLKQWETPRTVNSFVVPARPRIRSQIIDPWRAASGCAATVADLNCNLNFARAPFRLLAIVNRPDLRRPVNGTQLPSGGQGRFVFGALGPSGKLLFTVIFEYDLPVTDLDIPGIDDAALETRAWAEGWHYLSDLPFGPDFNDWLFNLTSRQFIGFTARDRTPSRPNGSALFQIRTNEVALSPVLGDPVVGPLGLWEMREFVIGTTGQLVQTTVKQEPDASFNGSTTLGAYVAENAAAILAGQHQVPQLYRGRPFLGGAAPVPFTLQWAVPGAAEDLRHAFALATCSGCHRPETGIFFLQVRPRDAGVKATVSAFVTSQITGPRKADYESILNEPLTAYLLGPGLDIGHGDFD